MRQVQSCGGRATPLLSCFWSCFPCQDQPLMEESLQSLRVFWFEGISPHPKGGTSRTAFFISIISLLARSFLPMPWKQGSSKTAGPHPKTTFLLFLILPVLMWEKRGQDTVSSSASLCVGCSSGAEPCSPGHLVLFSLLWVLVCLFLFCFGWLPFFSGRCFKGIHNQHAEKT